MATPTVSKRTSARNNRPGTSNHQRTPEAVPAPPPPLEPKPDYLNETRLTGQQMRSGMYALRCGDKYLTVDHQLTGYLSKAHLDDNYASLSSFGRRMSKILYPAFLPAPLTPVKLIYTTNGLVTSSKPYGDDPWAGVGRTTWGDSDLHNMALAEAAAYEERRMDDFIKHRFQLMDSAMWPLLMAQYEAELQAEMAEKDPDAKWDAMRHLAARLFVAGMVYGVRAAQDKQEDEANEIRYREMLRKGRQWKRDHPTVN